MMRWLQDNFGFTRNEIIVVLCIAGLTLVGAAIRLYRTSLSPNPVLSHDYSQSDSIFLEKSRRMLQTPSHSPRDSAVQRAELPPGSININTASKQELMRLPGIGEQYAERIILYREDNGPYTSAEDLEGVKGIGPKTVEKLKKYVTVKVDSVR